jgi:hypothetical protein
LLFQSIFKSEFEFKSEIKQNHTSQNKTMTSMNAKTCCVIYFIFHKIYLNAKLNNTQQGATLDISNRVFRVNLVVMPRLVLDVVMGMNWMKEWDAVIDAGNRVLSLREPQGSGSFQVPVPRHFDFASISCATQVVPLP